MSFAIPTLRCFINKIGIQGATLSTPVWSAEGYCECGSLSVSGTVTVDVGSVVAYKIGTYSQSPVVSCGSYDGITTGNIAYFDNTGAGGDHFSCLNATPSGTHAVFIACNGSQFSNILDVYVDQIVCPTVIPAPTINIGSIVDNGNGTSTLGYTVTSNYCTDTYIEDNDSIGGPSATPGPGQFKYHIQNSGVTSSTAYITLGTGGTYDIRAITYFMRSPCTTAASTETNAGGTL